MSEVNYRPLPYDRLVEPRQVMAENLPDDLAEFYGTHEGYGIDSFAEIAIRFEVLSELKVVPFKETCFRGADLPEWFNFHGYLIAATVFGEEIYYVIEGPLPYGTILLLGHNVPTGIMEGAVVLSQSFPEWIEYLEAHDFHDDAVLHRSGITVAQVEAVDKRLRALNPFWKIDRS
jgi:hypothetical protein